MATITRLRAGALAPFDWASLSWFPLFAPAIRVEDYLEGNEYIVRAELPGIDPAKDIQISYADRVLKVEVTRTEEHKDKLHSEFHYGSFARTFLLPFAAREDTIAASYTGGILEITVQVSRPAPIAKKIPVTVGIG